MTLEFFASLPEFLAAFDFQGSTRQSANRRKPAHFWDLTSVGALDKVVLKFRREGTEVEVFGLNDASATIVDRLAFTTNQGALNRMLEH